MKHNGAIIDLPDSKLFLQDFIGEKHVHISSGTPLTDDAFDITDDEKIKKISAHFREIMRTLGLDMSDDSLKGTPFRVAKMFVKEIFSGLDPKNKPAISMFDNKYGYSQMLVEKNISIYSTCEHHFVPIIGKVHVAYFPSGKVIGLSKINRLVQYYCHRPQVQERLTVQIADELRLVLGTLDVAVMVEATHLCVSSRGVQDTHSSTITTSFNGRFTDEHIKNEFLAHIK